MKTKMIFLVLFVWTLGAYANDKDYFKLGWDYWNKKEFQKAFEAFDKACEEEKFDACWYLGFSYKLGIKIKKDEQKAKEYYQKAIEYANKACEKNDVLACSNLGFLYFYGSSEAYINIQKDKNKGLELWQKACELGNYLICYDLGEIIKDQDETKSKEYYQKGLEFANKACEKDVIYACRVLAQRYENALGTKDKAKANIFYKKAFELAQKKCLAGDFYHSCNFLGIFYLDQKAVPKDTQKAKEYLQKACDVESAEACDMLGTLYEVEQNTQKAKEYYKKACNLEKYSACNSLKDLKE